MSTYRLADEMRKLEDLGIAISIYVDRGKQLTAKELKAEIINTMLTEKTPCQPEEDGFLVRENQEAHFSVILRMPIRTDVAAVLAMGGQEKRLYRLTNFSNTEYLTVKRVSTITNIDGCTTKPPDNSFKVVSVADNILRIFEISIATRAYVDHGCLHFLTVQEAYTGQLYFDEELQNIMVPAEEYSGYQNWPSLRQLVSEMVDFNKLPREVRPTPKQILPVTEPNRGRVIFFNASTGLGLAKIANNEVAGIHWKELDIEVPFPYVKPGEEVAFSQSFTEKGRQRLVKVTPL